MEFFLLCREDGDNEFMNIVANKLTEKVCSFVGTFHCRRFDHALVFY